MRNLRPLEGAIGSVVAASLVAVAVAVGASAHTSAAPNLLKNGGADLGPAVSDASGVVSTIPSWTRTGSFMS